MEQRIAKLVINTHKEMYHKIIKTEKQHLLFPENNTFFKKAINLMMTILTFGISSPKVRVDICRTEICYEYYISFKIDEGRYYYIEKKPILVYNESEDMFYYDGCETKSIMTKNGIEKSLKILVDIKDRVLKIHPEYTATLTNAYNNERDMGSVIAFFSQFDK